MLSNNHRIYRRVPGESYYCITLVIVITKFIRTAVFIRVIRGLKCIFLFKTAKSHLAAARHPTVVIEHLVAATAAALRKQALGCA